MMLTRMIRSLTYKTINENVMHSVFRVFLFVCELRRSLPKRSQIRLDGSGLFDDEGFSSFCFFLVKTRI